jgi:thioredoxin reductase
MPPEELYTEAYAQLRRYPTVEAINSTVTQLEPGDRFEATLETGRGFTAKYLLLAQGVKFSYPPIPGITELWGREVWHCPYCHGFEVSGKRLLAIGDEIWLNGMKELLPVWTDKITWAPTKEVSQVRCAANGEKGIVAVISGSDSAFDQCIVQTTVVPRDALADKLGCRRNEKGQIVIDADGLTSLERVYAAGDQTPAGGQVNLAVAAGHQAGIAINEAMGLPDRPGAEPGH